jgi:hypothetical protein
VYQSEWIQTLFRFGSPLFGVFDSVDATLSNLAPKGGTRQFVTWLIMLDLCAYELAYASQRETKFDRALDILNVR